MDSTPPPSAAPIERFGTVLVANRGEIARRVIRTLRRLGIRSVAVYSDADAGEPHVREADVAVRIGPPPARESYLDIDAVLTAARATGADAIHPGYGFLSENAAFARACREAGVVFIGPGERAIEIMGDKIRARDHVAASGVPIVPGFGAEGMSDAEVADRAAEVGYPLIVKPSAGGGGKGMEVVRDAADLPAALATARRVAAAAFGDDTLLIERFVAEPRHIEVQVFADAAGAVVHLGERECTLQRRHQKVIEEAPSPIVEPALRARLGEAACAAAASVDYVGAGTVEFLVSGENPEEFFFLEMNTRLQVEHPVTESVTGLDLVEQQVRVAQGHPLGLTQDDVRLTGWSIEARVYAESPERGFLPATGTVLDWRPAPAARTDSAIETGSVVGVDYDPLVAKVIATAPDRATAVARLDAALADTVLLGVETNIAYLRTVLADERVIRGDLDTGLLDRLPPTRPAAPAPAVLAAARDVLRPAAGELWEARDGWRAGGVRRPVAALFDTPAGVAEVSADEAAAADAVTVRDAHGTVWVHAGGATVPVAPLSRRDATLRRRAAADPAHVAPALTAPLPGTVVALHVADGDRVRAGDKVLTIEAMKMEHALSAPRDGVARLRVPIGASVARGERVADVETPADDPSDPQAQEASHAH
ncbi:MULTISPECIES: acetyl/propionyl/methylcrotonyl-CoA carboxylase subunit alpha [Microbacterium]|uniref:biotin carboxylase n=1 Tax=Microbacterium wangchenii TaxID=2541726 RepID=A0ABX5SR66_9MICO|nr:MULTISPECIES: biotin carboxylase N-terminal domain-containing protein [Microbacterium]MCK6065177.1 ATP-grasp domain-containing protein [Microbacterium sp. EYE_512]QBR88631.1 ATP-grasp domain-containing protein [Microbacterium wangchenii]TXK20356.1 ATP-grasp domain-containing protein [Microbacterium wangchenii]